MYRKYLAGLMVLPVVLAAWLTFSASPVVGLPVDELAMYDLPDEMTEVAEAEPAPSPEAE